jgi:hypothetical protein
MALAFDRAFDTFSKSNNNTIHFTTERCGRASTKMNEGPWYLYVSKFAALIIYAPSIF